MPWLQWLQLVAVLADPELLTEVVLAEEAGALAVIIYDTVERQSTAVLAIAGPFPNPRTHLKRVTFLRFRASSHVCISKFLKLISLRDSLGFFGFVPYSRYAFSLEI